MLQGLNFYAQKLKNWIIALMKYGTKSFFNQYFIRRYFLLRSEERKQRTKEYTLHETHSAKEG